MLMKKLNHFIAGSVDFCIKVSEISIECCNGGRYFLFILQILKFANEQRV